MAKKYLTPPAEQVETVGPEDRVEAFVLPDDGGPTVEPTPAAIAGVHQHRAGTYEVVLTGRCPKRIVETGLPAGPAAEAVARERYMRHYELVQRPGMVPDVKLME